MSIVSVNDSLSWFGIWHKNERKSLMLNVKFSGFEILLLVIFDEKFG